MQAHRSLKCILPMTEGTGRKLVRPEDVDAYLQDGWVVSIK